LGSVQFSVQVTVYSYNKGSFTFSDVRVNCLYLCSTLLWKCLGGKLVW